MDPDYVFATYHASGDDLSAREIEKQALKMVSDAGVGTWTEIDLARYGVEHSKTRRIHGARLATLHASTGTIKIAFPLRNFEPEYGGIPFLLNTVAGDLLGSSDMNLRLVDLDLPKGFWEPFPGPNLGIQGLRELCRVPNRPLLAFSVKPRLGLPNEVFAKLCREALEGQGLGKAADIAEDDTRLLSEEPQSLSRIEEVRKVLDDLRGVYGTKLYSVNLTGRSDRVLERAKRSIDSGANALKLDVLAAGFSALQTVAEYVRQEHDGKIPIFVYPGMYALYESSIDRKVLLRLSRLAGADIVYAGTPTEVGRLDAIRSAVDLTQYHAALLDDLYDHKPTMPSVAAGLHPGKVEFVKTVVGHNDFAYFVGGGIAGHPEGIKAGAALFAKAIDFFHVQEARGNGLFDNHDLVMMTQKGWQPEEVSDELRERVHNLGLLRQ